MQYSIVEMVLSSIIFQCPFEMGIWYGMGQGLRPWPMSLFEKKVLADDGA
jgi:hypothetical protein